MSYILDALKKSDRERQAVGAPNVAADPYPAPARGLSWALWGVVGLVLLNSAGLGILYVNRDAATPSDVATSPVAAVPPQMPVAVAQPAPVETVDASVAEPTVVDNGEQSSITVIATPERLRSGTKTAEEQQPVPQQNQSMPAVAASDLQPAAIAEPPRVVAQTPEANEILDQAANNIPTLSEMSPEFQASVPALNLDVHVYDKRPEKRFVLINAKRLKDGETVAEGVKLERIVAKGVILSKRGIMFALGAGE
jgi:general secretion pathway protein B